MMLREFHRFEAAGRDFVYLVPSAAVFELDATASAILSALADEPVPKADLIERLSPDFDDVEETISELHRVRAIGENGVPAESVPKVIPAEDFPLTTMVLNVTNQCNLSCPYCYEY